MDTQTTANLARVFMQFHIFASVHMQRKKDKKNERIVCLADVNAIHFWSIRLKQPNLHGQSLVFYRDAAVSDCNSDSSSIWA